MVTVGIVTARRGRESPVCGVWGNPLQDVEQLRQRVEEECRDGLD